ncbi:MAG: hypothetical protein QXY98_04500 [Thermoplasmata archaeon]
MEKITICIPSDLPGGLDARPSKSLEDSDVYNFVQVERNGNHEEISLKYQRFSCHAIACLDPVEAIAKKGAIAIVVRSISPEYLIRFLQAGVKIYVSNENTVLNSARAFVAGKVDELTRMDFSSSARK